MFASNGSFTQRIFGWDEEKRKKHLKYICLPTRIIIGLLVIYVALKLPKMVSWLFFLGATSSLIILYYWNSSNNVWWNRTPHMFILGIISFIAFIGILTNGEPIWIIGLLILIDAFIGWLQLMNFENNIDFTKFYLHN
jgi:hypothetical protein